MTSVSVSNSTATAPAAFEDAPTELPPLERSDLQRLIHHLGYPAFVTVEVVIFLALWEYATVVTGWVNPVFMPGPSQILGALVELAAQGTLWPNIQYSLTSWSIGYGLACVVGVALGLAIGTFDRLGRIATPIAWSLYATPHVSIRPMLVIWFGFGLAPIIALVFVSAIFPILVTSAAGPATVDDALIRAGRVYGMRWLALQRKIVLPASLPLVLTGMRLAIPTSLIGMLIGEIMAGGEGIGAILALGAATFRVDQAIAAIVILVTASILLIRAFGLLQRRLVPWEATGGGGQ